MKKLNNVKTAFTMAEVLIAISIIGILASILIPCLDKSKPDQLTLNYRKAFFAVEAAVTNIANDPNRYKADDNGDIDLSKPFVGGHEVDDTTGEYFCKNLAEQLNTLGAVYCPSNANGSGPNGLQGLDLRNSNTKARQLNLYNNLETNQRNYNFIIGNGITIGGIIGTWEGRHDNSYHNDAEPEFDYLRDLPADDKNQFMTLCIDVNGIATPPNVGCAPADRANVRRDQYRIRISRNGRIFTGSPVGPNNWYAENIMLVNPRKIIEDRRDWSEAEQVNLVAPPGAIKPMKLTEASPTITIDGKELRPGDLGYTQLRDMGGPDEIKWGFVGSTKSTMQGKTAK